MHEAFPHVHLVPYDGSFRVGKVSTEPPHGVPKKDQARDELDAVVKDIADLQRILWANDRRALLLVFQALDAAGKDGTIRAVLTGVNPAGCEVYSFKQPTAEELDHDFLWRTARCLPERGCIGVFNRSYYEEVLVVRVHPEYLEAERLPGKHALEDLWKHRYESIREHEQHLARNGTVILKFWLNVSKEEQRKRFLARLDEPDKNWKFSAGDVREREFFDEYMKAYEDALNETSRPWAPWFAIPADHKSYMRLAVAEIVRDTLKHMKLSYPEVDEAARARFADLRRTLEA